MDLHRLEMEAVAKSGPLERYDLAVRRAQDNVHTARERYFAHLRAHGCVGQR